MTIKQRWIGVTGLVLAATIAAAARADEGMWLFSNPPKKLLQERYTFAPPDQWYSDLQQASVRFNSGGSGEFVSSDGLVLTNHHIGVDALEKLSTPEKNYVADGFYARTRSEELKCPDVELNVLVSVEDVTARVNAAVHAGSSLADAEKARRAVTNTIEQESAKATGLRSDVIMLYHGGLYELYRFKKYTDVRLVFAPEDAIASFGGDPDNFEYPRYDLDICFFRVYENDAPAKIKHFLKWNRAGVADGDLIFVSGHPGRTDRQDTMAHLELLRDVATPLILNVLRRREVLLSVYGARSDEDAREAQEELLEIQNGRKAARGPAGRAARPGADGREAGRRDGVSQGGGRRSETSGAVRSGLGGHRRRLENVAPDVRRGKPAGARHGLQQPPVRHRPRPPPPGRRKPQAQRRAAPRVPRVESCFAGAAAFQPGADL